MTLTFSGLRLRGRLTASFCALLTLTVTLGAVAAWQLQAASRIASDISERWLPTVRSTLELRALMNEFRSQEFEHILAADQRERQPNEQRMAAIVQAVEAQKNAFAGLTDLPAAQESWGRVIASWDKYLAEHQKISKLAQADNADTARALIRGSSLTLFAATMTELDKLVKEAALQADAAASGSRNRAATAQSVIFGAVAVALALGLGLAWQISRSISAPLEQAVRAASAVAGGNLRVDLRTSRTDEVGDLFMALRTMADGLAGVVSHVRSGVETIGSASREIAGGTQDLSDRTERQSGELQETASRLVRLTSAAGQNAEVAQQAQALATATREVAVDGGRIVDSVVQRMGDISQSSKQIAEITGVIDSIAFQTNILALNAAVEAARAGEQGRGFAVVAGEVRSLAQRSAQAAKEIRVLIAGSVETVEAGSALVNTAGQAMHQVLERTERLSALVTDIASFSQGQRDEMHGLSHSVNVLEGSTQENASMCEQSAAASSSLNEQVSRLTQAVAVFQVA